MQEYSRVDRPLADAAPYYNSLAGWYDLLASSEKKFTRQGLEFLDPRPGQRILEIGFGTGYAQQRIASAVPGGFSAGVDISLKMAGVALGKINKGDYRGRVGLVCSDSLPLPFSANCFDGLFSCFTLELFDSPLIPQLLAECQRVLKPAGRLVAVSLSRDLPLPWPGRIYETLHNRYPRLLDCRPIPLLALLESSGFLIREFQLTKLWGLPVALAQAENSPPGAEPGI